MLPTRKTFLSCLAVAAPLFASAPAMADCVAPTGKYVGAGAGLTAYPNGSSVATIFLNMTSGTTGTISTAWKLSSAQGQEYFAFTQGSVQIVRNGYWEKNATPPTAGVDPQSCTGILLTDENASSAPATASSSASVTQKLRKSWNLTVSDGGKILTLTQGGLGTAPLGAQNPAMYASTLYTITLVRQ